MTGDSRKPEGHLLKAAMERAKMSARAVAAQISMSEARVRNIVNGYQAVGHGQRIEVIGPEDTVARIAQVLKVTPEELESAGRPDAAHALRRRLPGGPLPDWGRGIADDDVSWRQIVATHEEIREWAEDPENFVPPDAILSYFSAESLASELEGRVERAERQLGGGYWQVDPGVSAAGGLTPSDDELARWAEEQVGGPKPDGESGEQPVAEA